jgi:uroporphyrinogen III methyltransferase / synthase
VTARTPKKPVVTAAFVGAGPGDPGLLTVRATDLLTAADVVLVQDPEGAGAPLADLARRHAGADLEVLDVATGEDGQPLTPSARARLVCRAAKAGRSAVRLLPGDGQLFTGLAEELVAVRRAGVPVEVVPGVSPATAVPVHAGVPVTTSATAAVQVVDAAGRYDAAALAAAAHATTVLLGDGEEVTGCAGALVDAGLDAGTAVVVTAGGTTTAQRTAVSTLGDVKAAVEEVAPAGGEPLVAVTGAGVALRERATWFESKPLFGWRVLVPRTQAQSGPMVERLASHGAVADVVPTISVEPPRSPHQMEKAVKGLVTGAYEWIGFTSVNAVRAVREKFVEFGLDARAFSGLKVAAVGGVTAQALREWGIEPDLVPAEEQSAQGLLAVWPPYDEVLDPINGVFLPRADIATDTLVAGLQQLGWAVDDVTAYRTVRAAPPAAPIRQAIKDGSFDAVVFTSSSTVRNLVGIAGKPHPATVVACIGPATAQTATEHGLRVDVLAEDASSAALVDALAAHGTALREAAEAAGERAGRPSDRRAGARRRSR